MIACRYCGGFHERAAEVRACWAERSAPRPPSEPFADTAAGGSPDGRQAPATPLAHTGPAGPEALGRNLILTPGGTPGDPPAPWQGCELLDIGEARSVGDRLIDLLLTAAHERRRLVFVESEADAAPDLVERRGKRHIGRRGVHRIAAKDDQEIDRARLHVGGEVAE